MAAGAAAGRFADGSADSRRLGRSSPLTKAPAPCKLKVTVSLAGKRANDWEIWVYPSGATASAHGRRGQRGMGRRDEGGPGGRKEHPAVGRRELGRSLPGSFLPVFWSPVWFPSQVPNTSGMLCNARHPLLAGFPTEFHTNWQWYDLLKRSRAMILDGTPGGFHPVVQMIDNFARNHKLGTYSRRVSGRAAARLRRSTFPVTWTTVPRRGSSPAACTPIWLPMPSSPQKTSDVADLDKLLGSAPAQHQ